MWKDDNDAAVLYIFVYFICICLYTKVISGMWVEYVWIRK